MKTIKEMEQSADQTAEQAKKDVTARIVSNPTLGTPSTQGQLDYLKRKKGL